MDYNSAMVEESAIAALGVDFDEVAKQLHRIFASKTFRQADRIKRFLDFIVKETVAGRAEKLKEEAESTLAAYRKAIGEARAAAQAEITAATEAMAAEASRREGELSALFAEKSKAVERGIIEAKTRAIADLKNVAGEAARELVTRLVGAAPAPSDVTEAVEAVGRERAAGLERA